MKKGLLTFILIFSLFSSVYVSNVSVVKAEEMNVSSLIELLISIGAIPSDKAEIARMVVSNSNPTNTLPYVQVLFPNGGEKLDQGLTLPYGITWGASSQLPVMVSLVPNRGETCNLNYQPILSKSGKNILNIFLKNTNCFNLKTGTTTPLVEGVYKVHVAYADPKATSTESITVKDESDATFQIVPSTSPAIKVIYPNGGEKLIRKMTYDLKYSLAGVDDGRMMYINLLDSEGKVVAASQRYGRDGAVEFKFTSNLLEGAYKISLRRESIGGEKYMEDISDNFFWLSNN